MDILTNLQYTFQNTIELYKRFFKKNFTLLVQFGILLTVFTYIALFVVGKGAVQKYGQDFNNDFVGNLFFYISNGDILVYSSFAIMLYGLFAAFLQRIDLKEDETLKFKHIFSYITATEKLAYLFGSLAVLLIAYLVSGYYGLNGKNFYYGIVNIFGNSGMYNYDSYLNNFMLNNLLAILNPYIVNYSVVLFVCWILAKNYGKVKFKNLLKAALVSWVLINMTEVLLGVIADITTLLLMASFYIFGSDRVSSLETMPIFVYVVTVILSVISIAFFIPAISGALLYSNEYYLDDIPADNSSNNEIEHLAEE